MTVHLALSSLKKKWRCNSSTKSTLVFPAGNTYPEPVKPHARILCISSILQKELNTPGTDDQYQVQGFSLMDRNMTIDPVDDHCIGDLFMISGMTNIPSISSYLNYQTVDASFTKRAIVGHGRRSRTGVPESSEERITAI